MLCGDLTGREIKNEGIYMYIADSLCCAAETNTKLKSNYTPIKFLKNESIKKVFHTNNNNR